MLPADHPIHQIPEYLQLYKLVAAKCEAGPVVDLVGWAYQTAWEHNIPGEAVSKVLTLVRQYEGK
ncbi:MAG: hypothetical protein A2Y38_15715 [Spirochaetes bacterium GWB1_59_5]|nr:MAG: hypothetical protein A2Y38_15715 [Spirochaetes bacterium GWB1_59_5]